MVDTDDTLCMTDDGRQTMIGVWHKLPTGELKMCATCVFYIQLDCTVE